ncbi:hypothetical protein TNCV_4804141 [Trichonephila clavipes]|nr:hypothetical protein TNCV_4804141 [Trichonephila clavipes]
MNSYGLNDLKKHVVLREKLIGISLNEDLKVERDVSNFDFKMSYLLFILNYGIYYTRAFGDGPRNFEPWSSDVDDTTDLTYIAALHVFVEESDTPAASGIPTGKYPVESDQANVWDNIRHRHNQLLDSRNP